MLPVYKNTSKRIKGEYGEGDRFLGLRVPVIRKIAKKYRNISISEASEFLQSQFHEERLFSLFVLIYLFKKANDTDKKKIFTMYLNNTKSINNSDPNGNEYVVWSDVNA